MLAVQVVDLQIALDSKEEELRAALRAGKREKTTKLMNEVCVWRVTSSLLCVWPWLVVGTWCMCPWLVVCVRSTHARSTVFADAEAQSGRGGGEESAARAHVLGAQQRQAGTPRCSAAPLWPCGYCDGGFTCVSRVFVWQVLERRLERATKRVSDLEVCVWGVSQHFD
jgi:hypothetical protein